MRFLSKKFLCVDVESGMLEQSKHRNPCNTVDLKSIHDHAEYVRAKGLDKLFSLLLTDALLHPEEAHGCITPDTDLTQNFRQTLIVISFADIEGRFKFVLKEQIERREAANKDINDISEIENTLQAAATQCQQHPWKPRPPSLRPSTRSGASAFRPNTAPAGSADQRQPNTQMVPPKTAPTELKKSPSILQLQSERDRFRRQYYEQVMLNQVPDLIVSSSW